jgi:predicted Abi (CAAX) family protease
MPAELVLDPQIRDWVLIPIVVVMFLVGVLRHFATKLVKSEPKTDATQIEFRSVLLIFLSIGMPELVIFSNRRKPINMSQSENSSFPSAFSYYLEFHFILSFFFSACVAAETK